MALACRELQAERARTAPADDFGGAPNSLEPPNPKPEQFRTGLGWTLGC